MTNELLLSSLLRGKVKYEKTIRKYWKAEVDLILAIMQTESSFVETAKRHEPSYQKNYIDGKREWNEFAARWNCYAEDIASSYGLMQLMLPTAHQYGFRGHPAELLTSETNLKFGCQIVEGLFKRYHSLKQVIAAYNAGTPVICADGSFKNQPYVEKVLFRMDVLRAYQIRKALNLL